MTPLEQLAARWRELTDGVVDVHLGADGVELLLDSDTIVGNRYFGAPTLAQAVRQAAESIALLEARAERDRP